MRRIRLPFPLVLIAITLVFTGSSSISDATADELMLQLRDRVPYAENDQTVEDRVAYKGPWKVRYRTQAWDPAHTAVIVCDMWDKHWCPSASRRVAEMAPRMDEVLGQLRSQGALVIHCPSDTLDFYDDTPQRRRAKEAPKAAPEAPSKWYPLDPSREAPLPIDDSDEGCAEDVEPHQPWHRQIDTITIAPEDAITDGAEIYHLMHARDIDNVIIMGVHTNMCVLGRPFGIRNLVTAGKNVVLMRDMTDTMYNPAMPPHVSHFRGTELVVEHIEKYWCPTVTSTDVLSQPAFRFEADDRPHVAILVSDDHYGADVTLPMYADTLRADHGCYVTVLHGEGSADIRHTVELEEADCLILFIRRLALPEDQLRRVRDYLAGGGPLVALRTASHAFDTKGKIPPGAANWVEFDPEVLGGNYHGHAGNALESDIQIVPARADHPILRGIQQDEWHSSGSLYFTGPLADDCTLLMTGTTPEHDAEPVTWCRTYGSARVAYSALGHPDDFAMPPFRKLVANMVFWSMDRSESEE